MPYYLDGTLPVRQRLAPELIRSKMVVQLGFPLAHQQQIAD